MHIRTFNNHYCPRRGQHKQQYHRQPPDEEELQLADRSSEEMRTLNDAAWGAFWGWDCCGPDGLLERVYRWSRLWQIM